jgi:Protein of unknown function (DUF3088)
MENEQTLNSNFHLMIHLFLLKPFTDPKSDNVEQLYYCPPCTTLTGLLSYYPELKNEMEVVYVDFPRPRKIIIDLVGEENQGCPLLVIDKSDATDIDISYFQTYNEKFFVQSVELISKFLTAKFKIGALHF